MTMLFLLLGCNQDNFVTLVGTAFSDDEPASALPGATLTAYDFGIVETDEVTSDADGAFELQVRAGGIFYLELAAPGHRTTGLTGSVGQADFTAGDGLVWLRSDEQLDVIQGDFAGCPGWDGDGAIIEGEIRLFQEGLSAENSSRSLTGWATAIDQDGNEFDACYLADDEERVAYDPEATITGFHGRFAIFDAPTGPISIEVGYFVEDIEFYSTYYYLYVPEGGITPLYPAWVELY